MPGQHKQFQLWYIELLPLFIALTGVQPLLLLCLFNNLFPACEIVEMRVAHFLLLLSLIALMLTVGPINLKII